VRCLELRRSARAGSGGAWVLPPPRESIFIDESVIKDNEVRHRSVRALWRDMPGGDPAAVLAARSSKEVATSGGDGKVSADV
jgi:hypothetical protein